MAISINTRKLDDTPDLVLYVDVQKHPETGIPTSFLAEIYEADQTTLKAFPSLPVHNRPLFHCYGKRKCEWEAALALLDVLITKGTKRVLTSKLEGWYDKVKAMPPGSHILCIKVRDKGQPSNPFESTIGIADFCYSGITSSQLVYQNDANAHTKISTLPDVAANDPA